jgi:TRAP-type C4-dicarboxylate transport system permease small subunit
MVLDPKEITPKPAFADEYKRHTKLTLETAPAWLFAIVVLATTYEVVARYVFDAPTTWANEMSLYVCAIGYIYAGVYSMRHDRHLRITVIYEAVPLRLRKVFDVIQYVVILTFCAALSIYGFDDAWTSLITWEKYGTAFNAPIPATIKPLIVLAGIAMAIYATRNLIARLREKQEG